MIKTIINQQKEERDFLLGQVYIKRIDDLSIEHYRSTKLIKLITGPRRAGKSVLALQLLNGENFAYLNFDDDLLLNNFDEDKVAISLNEVYPKYSFLLLDEIQNLKNWELWVNKLYRRGVNLVITGSNANLLSNEIATTLTGRFVQIPVFPFSFEEVGRFTESGFHKQAELTPKEIGDLLNRLKNYMINGGYPETVRNPEILKNYLSSLFDSILLKDILKRYRIRQTQQLYDLSNYLLSNYTNTYTANQLKTDLNFNSVVTVQKFIGYLVQSYLLVELTRYYSKIKKQKKSPKKVYIIDNGFINARSFELSPNYGRMLENLVFIELLRRRFRPDLELFYYRTHNNKEIDFLLRKGHSVSQLLQVCYNVSNPKTLKREVDALITASDELKCYDLVIITWDREDYIEKNSKEIKMIPAYKWLLA